MRARTARVYHASVTCQDAGASPAESKTRASCALGQELTRRRPIGQVPRLYTFFMKFAPEYVNYVLNDNFEDAKALFLSPLMAIHHAHLVMLAETDIVSREDAHRIREALDGVSLDEVRDVRFDGTCEDLFFYVEGLLVASCGDEIAGRLHTARSRNDIDMTMYRMRQREFVLDLVEGVLTLRASLLDLASQHRDTIMAAHTHTQPAQPSTIAHYLLAMIEQLERDSTRLRASYQTTNRNPLGACAITGTGFPIDRSLTSELLGFDGATGNTYGSIATVDYLLESTYATAITLAGLGRFVQDLLLWGTAEVNYVRFGDGFVQSSSIMPQKRNPVAIEHARAIGSKAVGQAHAIGLAVHNTPFGDIVDTEDDLQPLVWSMFRDATRAVRLVAAAMQTATFDATRLEARAGQGGTTMTELSDTLVREHGVPFKTAHTIAGRVLKARAHHPQGRLTETLAAVCLELVGRPILYTEERLHEILSPRYFVTVRRTPGGPAPDQTAAAVAQSAGVLTADREWAAARREALASARRELKERSAAL
jgi:argininosuccinate lyase